MAVRKRVLGALAAGAILAPLSLASPASAAPGDPGGTPVPAQQSIAEVCAGVPDDFRPFTDVAGNTHEEAILCAAFADIARGNPENIGADKYGPFRNVRRDQMASFIARLIDTANEQDCDDSLRDLPAGNGTTRFTDVPRGNTHFNSIDRLEDAGIVLGAPDGQPATIYGPERPVKRDQMASFINRALEYLTGESNATGNDFFTDDERSVHEPRINAIAEDGIVVGRGGQRYDPFATVRRDEMASFLIRTLGELFDRGEIIAIGQTCAAEGDVTVTPDNEAAIEVPGGSTSTATATRSFTATGLVPGQEYRITLVNAANATRSTTAPGGVQFTAAADSNSSTGFSVNTGIDPTNPQARILSIEGDTTPSNNSGPGTAETAATFTAVFVADADGTVTFVVGSNQVGFSFFPVVYVNGGGDGSQATEQNQSARLEVTQSGFAVEEFDAGGTSTVRNDQP